MEPINLENNESDGSLEVEVMEPMELDDNERDGSLEVEAMETQQLEEDVQIPGTSTGPIICARRLKASTTETTEPVDNSSNWFEACVPNPWSWACFWAFFKNLVSPRKMKTTKTMTFEAE